MKPAPAAHQPRVPVPDTWILVKFVGLLVWHHELQGPRGAGGKTACDLATRTREGNDLVTRFRTESLEALPMKGTRLCSLCRKARENGAEVRR